MNARTIVLTLLKASTAVKAKVPAARMYPIEAPENAANPKIVVFTVGGRDDQVLSGAASYYENRVRVLIEGDTATSIDAIEIAVHGALDNVVKQTVGVAKDVDIWFADFDIDGVADDVSSFTKQIDFYVRWRL
jgi:hypothetical protein